MFYFGGANHREFKYLQSNAIGVDIGGVLNKHRHQFSELLKKNTGKTLGPEEITKIPVRDIQGKDISIDDELAVFNDPDYWIKMPVMDDCDS